MHPPYVSACIYDQANPCSDHSTETQTLDPGGFGPNHPKMSYREPDCVGKTSQIPSGLLENLRFFPLYWWCNGDWYAGKHRQLNSCDSRPALDVKFP